MGVMKENLIKFVVLILIFVGVVMSIVLTKNSAKPLNVAFFGDSITQYGWEQEKGYVRQVVDLLDGNGIVITPIPAGRDGHTSFDLLERMDRDVLSKNPEVMFFMGGLNDIWLNKGTFKDYQNNIFEIVQKAQDKNIKVVMMNLTIIGENTDSSMNKTINKYNDFLAQFAKEHSILLIDLNSEMKEALKNKKSSSNLLTKPDGVHLNERGNTLIARKIAKDFTTYYKNENAN